MATLPHSDSKRAYSWLWDSHISPKNSKWLQENLTDMDVKVKSMIKLIEEDADSFSRRAEMYYKKRPELMKLVEDFYRCYRALAERYNHATGELRHAHRTIAKAFYDQDLPFDELINDDSSQGLASETDKNLRREMNKEGFKKLKQMFEDKETAEQQCSKSGEGKSIDDSFTDDETMVQLSNENQDLKDKVLHEAERAGKAESVLQDLKKTLADMRAEKENVLLKYHKCLEKLSDVEVELNNARKDSATLNEEASRAEIEVRSLKEALVQLETEKNAGLVKHRIYLEKISDLEAKFSRLELENKGLNAKADASESEAQNLRDEISRSQIEKESVFQQHKECLERISVLENLISVAENNANMFKERAGRAENEVSELKMSLADLKKEKEDFALEYKRCLETISKLEKDISNAQEDVKRLNGELLIGNLKLKTVEDKCALLEKSNLSLRAEADDLGQKISMKDQELSEKQEELENLQKSLLHEQSRHAHVEATLESIQNLRSRSQDEQRSLTLELKNALQMLSDLEASKHGLEQEIRQVRDENRSLSETNLSSAVSNENMQSEIVRLQDLKERLKREVSYQSELSESLQLETCSLKEEIQGLNMRYKALLEQVDASGLGQRNLAASVNNLKHENEKLRQMCELESNEKEVICKKLENMEEILKAKSDEETSLSDLTNELEKSRERMRSLQDSCQSFEKEKAMLITEKVSLIDQLQAITKNMHNVLGKNAVLENSLSNARVELEGLREKSKGLEEICEILKSERCRLLSERETLVIKLENVEKRLEKMEEKYAGLEAQYAGLHQEKEAIRNRADELAVSLSLEKQERANIRLLNETKLAGLEHQVQILRDENKWKRKEFEDELDRAVKYQFEISILHKFMKDMEEKNTSLIIECQKHVEASKLAEKVISELESESLEQQVESELMLDEIERLRSSIYDVFNVIEAGPDCDLDEKFENEESLVHHILSTIEDMKFSVTKHEDDKQLLLVENSVLLTLLEQFESKVVDVESQKACLEREFKIMSEKFWFAQNQKGELLETNANLKSEVTESHEHNNLLDVELRILHAKESDLKQAYNALKEAYSQVNRDNEVLLLKFSDLKKEKDQVECHNDTVLEECIASANDSIALKSFAEEKVAELKLLLVNLNRQFELNSSLQKEMNVLKEQLELQRAENLILMDTVSKLETEMKGLEECNAQMRKDVISVTQTLLETEGKLLVKELKLEAAENANLKLCTEVDELNSEIQDSLHVRKNLEKNILQMSETNSTQRKEIERLNMVKTNLKSKLGSLHEEIKQITIREKALNTELSKKNKDFELWEADAASLYLNLQFRSINEILFGHKVMELSEVCQTLANENDSKTLEILQLKGEVSSMESVISGLKYQIKAYDPVIAALKDDITFLEHNALLQKNMKSANHEEQEFAEAASDPSRTSSEVFIEDQTLLSLQDLVLRIKAVSKLMEETSRPVSRRRSSKQETKGEIENLKLSRCLGRDRNGRSRRRGCMIELSDTPKLQKLRSKGYEVRNRGLTKDIHQVSGVSLHGTSKNMQETDQIHEFMDIRRDQMASASLMMSYKTFDRDLILRDHNINHKSKNPSTDSDMERELGVDSLEISTRSIDSSKETNCSMRVLERLTSDAEKLEILHGTVETLRKKVEAHKRSRKAKNVDFDTVYDQLLEAEETVISLMDMNDRLTKNVEEWPSPPNENISPGMRDTVTTRRRRIAEQARRGSEKIFRLQLEIQKIQCVLLELDDEKKGKNKLFKSKAIILRDLIYNGGKKKNTKPKKKSRICGCVRPSTSSNGRG